MATSPRPMKNPRYGKESMGSKSMASAKSPKDRAKKMNEKAAFDAEIDRQLGAAAKGYKKGGCVMAGRGGKYKGSK